MATVWIKDTTKPPHLSELPVGTLLKSLTGNGAYMLIITGSPMKIGEDSKELLSLETGISHELSTVYTANLVVLKGEVTLTQS